jgi:hypothetical protein
MADEILSGLKGIKAEIKAVQDQMIGLDAGSQEFVKLAQRAGELRDQMKDVAEAVNANAGPAIGNFGNNLSIARGQLGELDITGFGESMKRMGANVKSVSFKDMGEGVKSVGGGFASLGKALLTNPIFLISTAILGIVANFDKLKNAGGAIGQVFTSIGKILTMAIDGLTMIGDRLGLINSQAMEMADRLAKRQEAEAKATTDFTQLMLEEREKQKKINMTAYEREIYDAEQKYKRLLDLGLKSGFDEKRVKLSVEDAKNKEIAAINDKYAKEAAAKKKADDEKALAEAIKYRELDQKNFEDTIQSKDATLVNGVNKQIELQTTLTSVTISEEDKRTAAERKAQEDREQIMQAAWDSKYELALAATNSMMALNDALTQSGIVSAEKGFKIGKALSIAQTTISTIMGVQNALNAASTLPEPFGMALKVANAVTIGAAGAASIAKIAASQFNPGGGGGNGGLDTPTMPSPSGGGAMSAPTSQSPSALNLSFLQGNVNAAPLQTYVLAGQVSNAQQAEFKIKNTASILGGG